MMKITYIVVVLVAEFAILTAGLLLSLSGIEP